MRKRTARKVRSHSENTHGVAVFIGSLLVLLIGVACIIKLLLMFHHSIFDGNHQFVLALDETHATQFVIFNPDQQTINSLTITGASVKNSEKNFLIPVDDSARIGSPPTSITDLTSLLVFHHNALHAKMTIIDAIKLFLFARSVNSQNEKFQTIAYDQLTNAQQPVSTFFIDNTLYKEGESISIINATSTVGLGSSVASLVSAMGGNVISVTSGNTLTSQSSVGYTGTLSYTATRLAHILHMPLIQLSGVQISDITVTVGTDFHQIF